MSYDKIYFVILLFCFCSVEHVVNSTEPVMPHASDMGDHRPVVRSITEKEHRSQRLSQVYDFLMKVKRVVKVKETNMCLLYYKDMKKN